MESRSFLYISLVVDILIAASKFIAAAVTGSAAMVSEGIHSVIDSISQLLLLWGIRLSRKRPDESRPFGYGREFYFWSFVVSLIIFVVGGCISFYEGLIRMHHPTFEGSAVWNYATLIIALIFTIVTLITALKAFNKERGSMSFWKAIVHSKDPSTFITLLGDAADILGIFVAFAGVFLGRHYHNPRYDGIASMMIGLMLIFVSLILVRESKSLLMGETTSRKTLRRIVTIAESDDAVLKVRRHFSMYLSPEEVILQLHTVFRDDLTTGQITDAIDRIIHQIKKEFPRMKQIFIEPVPMKHRK